jgi:type II secretory pathway component GspD/PulD (secretin)
MRGWRRWAAGLVLVPGLSTLGADALGLTSVAHGQYGRASTTSRTDEYKDLMRQAREAYDAGDYEKSKALAEKARSSKGESAFYEEDGDGPAKPAARPTKATTSDPKVLVTMAKTALDEGNLDKAQDLATQAKAHSTGVRWGLFDDTPDSILGDVKKSRGRQGRDQAAKLLADARHLIEMPAKTRDERAANLASAEEKAKQAASMNASYSMWDFGDRPAQIIADARKARDKEHLVAVRPAEDAEDVGPVVKPSRMPRKMPVADEGESPRGDLVARKKQAVALMQEGKQLQVSRKYIEAKQKYVEAARLNVSFTAEEGSPEAELARLSVLAQRKINALVDEARSCIELKDQTSANNYLDDAQMLAKGMGLDTSSVLEVRATIKQPSPVIRIGNKVADGPMPIIRSGRKTDDTTDPGVKTAGGEETPFEVIPPSKPAPMEKIVKPIPGSKPGPDVDAPPLPPVPNVDSQIEAIKPPKPVDPPVKPMTDSAVKPMPESVVKPLTDPVVKPMIDPAAKATAEKGDMLLGSARIEFKKGELESARKITIDLINGPYTNDLKEEAQTLLKSIDTFEAGRKIDSARRAFDNGMKAYQMHNYAVALGIFKQIDGTLLPGESRKNLSEMLTVCAVKAKEIDDVAAARTSEKLPTAPKPPVEIPDLPITGPAPAAVVKTGQDNLLKQQEALSQVEFQKLRSKALKVESEATNRFGRGETDAALMDLSNFIAEVKASSLETSKQNMLIRPIEARMDRLKILKHQTDFLTKESQDRRNFHADLTQEALAKETKQKDVALLMKASNKLIEEHKYKEAYAKLEMAQALDPDDGSVNGAAAMARQLMRMAEDKKISARQEEFNYEAMQGMHDLGSVTEKEYLKVSDDPEMRAKLQSRALRTGNGNIGLPLRRSEKDKEIERKMSTPISVNFKNVPLEGVVDQLHSMTNINFDLDLRSLKEGNVEAKTPISANLKDVSLKSALTIICQQAGLKHIIQNEAIRITTPRGASGQQLVKSMPVGDLVIPAVNFGQGGGLPSLAESLNDARMSAMGMSGRQNSPTPRHSPGMPQGTTAGTGSEYPGGGRLTNSPAGPREGGITTGSTSGSLERELIRLITTTIKPDSWSSAGGEGTIEYFPLGLALVINQSPEVIEEVERLLESLRKLQDLEVSIEVKVVSLAETFYERIGVDFSMGIPTNAKPVGGPGVGATVTGVNNRNFGGNVLGLQVPGVPTPDLDIPIRATSFGRAVPPFGGFGNSFNDGGISLGLAFLSDLQVQMFLEAAQGDTRTNVMQAPKLTALNGTSASMTVGDYQFFLTGIQVASVNGQLVFTPQNVPYAVGITQPIPPNASISNGLLNFTPTQPQTPGLGLFIQPVVSADRRFVRLNIQQSFTNLISGTQQIPITTIITPVFENGGQGQPVPFTQFLQQPRFSNLETQTVVVVPDGGTVVMGGLKYMTEGRNEFGPPVLSKIPYLNRLFKNVAYGREGRSILIMVTPRVIINREEQERQTGVREDDFVGQGNP